MNKNRRKERQGKAYTRMQATSGGIHRKVTSQVRRFEVAETSWYPELQVEMATSPGCVPFHWSEPPERTGSPQSTGTDTHVFVFGVAASTRILSFLRRPVSGTRL